MRDPGVPGIVQLLRGNPDFRRLWLAQVVSQAGDWFNHVAILALLDQLTGSSTSIAWSLILRMLPGLFISPIAGVFIDRWNRKAILVATDVVRAGIVPCLAFADGPGSVPLVYVLLALQVSVSSVFEPARSAYLPSVVSRDELLSANALSSLTWSVMLAVGSALGGIVAERFGLTAAFVIDGASFLVSAWFIARIRAPGRAPAPAAPARPANGPRELLDGLSCIVRDRAILSLVLVKTGIGLAGGMVLLITVFGTRLFPRGSNGAESIGLLFAARGIGTAIGPFLGRALAGYHEPAMRRVIGAAFLQAALFFVLFSRAGTFPAALGLLLIAHLGTSMSWVFSTVLLQLRVPDELRGRVFSAELALFTLVFSVATFCTGYALDHLQADPRLLTALSGAALAVPGLLWIALRRRTR